MRKKIQSSKIQPGCRFTICIAQLSFFIFFFLRILLQFKTTHRSKTDLLFMFPRKMVWAPWQLFGHSCSAWTVDKFFFSFRNIKEDLTTRQPLHLLPLWVLTLEIFSIFLDLPLCICFHIHNHSSITATHTHKFNYIGLPFSEITLILPGKTRCKNWMSSDSFSM